MRPLKSLISFEEAMEIGRNAVKPVERVEKIAAYKASNRVLAQDIISGLDVPSFDRAAMDGYAVKANDTFAAGKFKPARLHCVEKIYTGQVPTEVVSEGKCSEIATGAIIPQGADAVVIVEDTEKEGEEILIYKPVYPGANITKRGEDIKKGDLVLRKGALLNPSRIGAVSALGLAELLVYAKPKVAIIPTGSEVATPGQELKPGQIYNINSYTLASVVEDNGGEADIFGVIEDKLDDLTAAVKKCAGHDLVLLSGGSSVGEKDIMLDVLENLGKILFHGVAVKPGKPTIMGMWGSKPVLGMPGYPTSCLSNAYMILLPILRQMARLPERVVQSVKLSLSRRQTSTLGRHQFLTVRVEGDQAVPVFKESGAITSMSEADGYIEIPPHVDLVEKGEVVEVKLL